MTICNLSGNLQLLYLSSGVIEPGEDMSRDIEERELQPASVTAVDAGTRAPMVAGVNELSSCDDSSDLTPE